MESVRVQFKTDLNPKTTVLQVLKTNCTFAHNLQSLNGGCVVLGWNRMAIRIDRDTLGYFKALANETGSPYQTLITERNYASSGGGPAATGSSRRTMATSTAADRFWPMPSVR